MTDQEFDAQAQAPGPSRTPDPALPVPVTQGQSAAIALVAAELDTQVATAKQYPRDASKAIKTAIQMATWDKDVASSCIYAKPAGGQVVRGCSIRLAEIMISCWGNIRVQPRIVEMDGSWVTVECDVWDLESNVKTGWVCRRRLTDKYGKRYAENVVENTIAAATAIAMRNATFKSIPKAYADIVYAACAKVIVGDAKSLAEQRTNVLRELEKLGALRPRILSTLGVATVDLIDGDMLVTLKGLGNAIRDGEIAVDEAFPDPTAGQPAVPPDAKGVAAVRDRLKTANDPAPAAKTQPAAGPAAAPVGEPEPDKPLHQDVARLNAMLLDEDAQADK